MPHVVIVDAVLPLEDVSSAEVDGGHPPLHVVEASGEKEPRHLGYTIKKNGKKEHVSGV